MYEYNDSGDPLRYYVHGVSYIDERLAMVNCYETTSTSDDRPYYYVLDRMYNVRALVDRAGSIVERYCYDPYGKPLIRESLGRGDQRGQDTILALGDGTDFAATTATPPTLWDPRADMDDDGDIDATDVTLKSAKAANWPNPGSEPTVSQAFSDVGNRYMFQGVPNFEIDTPKSATSPKFTLNHHRARFAEPVIGRWVTRDPLAYQGKGNFGSRFSSFRDGLSLYSLLDSNPIKSSDPTGLIITLSEKKTLMLARFKKLCPELELKYKSNCDPRPPTGILVTTVARPSGPCGRIWDLIKGEPNILIEWDPHADGGYTFPVGNGGDWFVFIGPVVHDGFTGSGDSNPPHGDPTRVRDEISFGIAHELAHVLEPSDDDYAIEFENDFREKLSGGEDGNWGQRDGDDH